MAKFWAEAQVLDLYAGTGALGLEAISRGALQAVLVESNRQAAQVCRHNSDLVLSAFSSEKPTIRIVEKPVTSFLAANRDVFDLVLIDPPYGVENLELEAMVAADPLVQYLSKEKLEKLIASTQKQMEKAAKELNFMEAARLRDEWQGMKNRLADMERGVKK